MILQDIWFFLWGLLWAVYFATDGFDLGVGMLLPFFSKSEEERRILYNSIGPLWNGNEVWLITAGGVTFAAFPAVYATMFSALYTPLMILLFALIVRGVAIDFREKSKSDKGKRRWDLVMFLGSLVASVLLGVAFGNIFMGLPIDKDGSYLGGFLDLLNPYGLITGLLFISVFLLHGTLWISLRTEGDLRRRAFGLSKTLWWVLLALLLVFLVLTYRYTDLFKNYFDNPVLFIVPTLELLSLVASKLMVRHGKAFLSWIFSFVAIVCVTFFGIIGLYPKLLPSSIDEAFSLTAHNASSSPLTLKIMLAVALIFVPIVILYQAWAYNLFRRPVGKEDLLY